MVDAPHQVPPITLEADGPLGAGSIKDGLSLADIGRILLKWKWLILACLLLSIVLGTCIRRPAFRCLKARRPSI